MLVCRRVRHRPNPVRSPATCNLWSRSTRSAIAWARIQTSRSRFAIPAKKNLLLNGGALLGNGAEIWSSIVRSFHAADGQRLPLSLGWGVPGVAGRIYFLGVPLRAGSAYTVSVTPRDYYVGKSERLAAGIYELACTYTGVQSSYRDSTQLPRCWEGLATSNTARVEVIEANR